MGFLRKLLCVPKKKAADPNPAPPAVPEKVPESMTTRPSSRRKPVASTSSASLEATPKQSPVPMPPILPTAEKTVVPAAAPVNPHPSLNAPVGTQPLLQPFTSPSDYTALKTIEVGNGKGGVGLDTSDAGGHSVDDSCGTTGHGVSDCEKPTAYDVSAPTDGPKSTAAAGGGTCTSPPAVTDSAITSAAGVAESPSVGTEGLTSCNSGGGAGGGSSGE